MTLTLGIALAQFLNARRISESLWFFLSGLNCYQCDSSKDEYCPETWDLGHDIQPESCDHVDYASFCVKTTGIYGAIVGTRRFCSSRNMDNQCMEVNIPQDPRIYYSCIYTCTTDGCNSAPEPRGLLSLKLLVACLALSLLHFLGGRFISA